MAIEHEPEPGTRTRTPNPNPNANPTLAFSPLPRCTHDHLPLALTKPYP